MKITQGYRNGNLTVISDTGLRKNGYIIWECLCDCGKTIQLDTRALQRGLIRDCGCITKVNPRQKDLTAMRFGKLTVLEPTNKRDHLQTTVWLCQCDCGKQKEVSTSMLRNGYVKSCGCLRAEALSDITGNAEV